MGNKLFPNKTEFETYFSAKLSWTVYDITLENIYEEIYKNRNSQFKQSFIGPYEEYRSCYYYEKTRETHLDKAFARLNRVNQIVALHSKTTDNP